jgi:hypothetical protein
MTNIKLETLCLGQITRTQSPAGWCYGCLRDDKNKECPHYIPAKLYEFEVEHARKLYDKKHVEDHFDHLL